MLKGLLYQFYERRLLADVLPRPTPRHLGLVQDGHRRYAREAGLSNSRGYAFGSIKTEEVLTWCAELRIPMVTLWWLSTENLGRHPEEVNAVLEVIEEKMTEWVRRPRRATGIGGGRRSSMPSEATSATVSHATPRPRTSSRG